MRDAFMATTEVFDATENQANSQNGTELLFEMAPEAAETAPTMDVRMKWNAVSEVTAREKR